ncbi:hypothetical protein CJD36_003860 [Flavipsychrobacter stenotrophus]|uniref:ATPase AAA-type core domain-containing protein n=1 Tax=Flavipsychrobacter stenotrophus TaxID=2077091 RepID=A0A2S7T1Z4_9BACT|nr:AAA family ATPase [Flavipsychrobacter stenotrophus]PQJ12891.1 hypothetical protein CJD36_003860 [Flavipsychrobacter stenotrophus]
MRVQRIRLKHFKRFDDLTIDLGPSPEKVIALVGPNGSGKSSIFDAFEQKMKSVRWVGEENLGYYSKSEYYAVPIENLPAFDRNTNIELTLSPVKTIDRKTFYIRTAYRFTSKIDVRQIESLPDMLNDEDLVGSTISIDSRLVNNYKRLIGRAYSTFDTTGTKTGNEIKSELLDKINLILSNVLDIRISSLGNILENKGQFYFEKENVKNFPYSNLSSGEKEVLDIIIDLIIKVEVFNDTVFCIDEPELHLNTAIQRKLIIELEKIIPDNCQLWVATHSIGFLRALQEELKNKSQVIDFSERNYFIGTQTIVPIKRSRKNWQRIFSTALEDLTGLIAPKRIIYCEGKASVSDNIEKGLDANIYNEIFSEQFSETLFVSSGGNTELDHRSEIAIAILGKVFTDLEIWILKDRDFDSGKYTDETRRQLYLKSGRGNLRILNRWEIENYLYDKEILKKYCSKNALTFNETKYDGEINDILNDNVKDKTGFIKACCEISFPINVEKFKIELGLLISEDTGIYRELVECIFGLSQ